MAIDTAQKRYSMLGFGGPFRALLPPPDGGFLTQDDRQQLIYLYSGLAAGTGAGTFRRGPTTRHGSVAERAPVPARPVLGHRVPARPSPADHETPSNHPYIPG